MANMRAAKERIRLARGPRDEEPRGRIVRHPYLSWAVRDELSGETVWLPMKSARDTYRRVTVLLKFYLPTATNQRNQLTTAAAHAANPQTPL